MNRTFSLFTVSALALVSAGCHVTTSEGRDSGPKIDRNYALGAFDRGRTEARS